MQVDAPANTSQPSGAEALIYAAATAFTRSHVLSGLNAPRLRERNSIQHALVGHGRSQLQTIVAYQTKSQHDFVCVVDNGRP